MAKTRRMKRNKSRKMRRVYRGGENRQSNIIYPNENNNNNNKKYEMGSFNTNSVRTGDPNIEYPNENNNNNNEKYKMRRFNEFTKKPPPVTAKRNQKEINNLSKKFLNKYAPQPAPYQKVLLPQRKTPAPVNKTRKTLTQTLTPGARAYQAASVVGNVGMLAGQGLYGLGKGIVGLFSS